MADQQGLLTTPLPNGTPRPIDTPDGPLPGAAPLNADQTMPPVAVDVPDNVVPASRQVESAEPPANPAPAAAQPAVTIHVVPVPAQTVPPAPPASIAVVPAPAPESSIMVAVSRLLASLSDALSGNTVPADAAVGMMSEVARRGRFAPATTAASPVAAATTTSTVTTVVEGEKMTIAPSSAGRILYDRRASGGAALAITGSGTATTTLTVPTATTGLVIRAKVSGGAPNMTLAIDGVAVTTLMVSSKGWTDFAFAGLVPAGSRNISVSTTTATSSSVLYLDKVSTITGSITDDFTGKYGSAPSDPLWGVRSGSGLDTGIQSYTTSNVFLDGLGHMVIQAVRGTNGTGSATCPTRSPSASTTRPWAQ